VDEKSFISPVVDLFREILYDILGLFAPGAALLLILRSSSFQSIHSSVEPITRVENNTKLALFIGASYVVGYAIQGFAGRIWGLVVVRIVRKAKKLGNAIKMWWQKRKLRKSGTASETVQEPPKVPIKVEAGMKGISPAFIQVKDQLESSELFRSLRVQIAAYCSVATPDNLSLNEVQNLAYSVAEDRAANAFRFSFRADLSNGMFMVFFIGSIETFFEFWRLQPKVWLVTLFVYIILTIGFALRTWFYLDIRGRIIYSIGLAVLADHRREKEVKHC